MSDGYHIGLLIMAALHYLCPEFIREKRLLWLRSPLYVIKNKGKEEYYFTDEEFEAIKQPIKGEVTRMKGLGALSAEQAKNSMFSSEFQRMDIMEINEESKKLLESLMGEDIEPRRHFLFNNVDFTEVRE